MLQAKRLFGAGINAAMTSKLLPHRFPKFVWSVDEDGTVYEAKTDIKNPGAYHGYPLEPEDAFRQTVLDEWKKRCR